VMERVEGSIPSDLYHTNGYLTEIAPTEREALWLSAIEAMAALHAAPPEPFAFLARLDRGASGLEQQLAAWDSYMAWSDAPVRPVQQRARRWLEDHMPPERPTGLAWGDARPGNMVFRNGRCAAVLDWETASLGGAETDLGWWLFYDWMVSEGMGVPRLDGLGGPAQFIRAWEGFADRRARAMDWHEIFATWRYSLVSDRARHLMRRNGVPNAPPADARSLPAERLETLVYG
jgi:aminoglycoside phosphotransferase (APT) family kinase protein